eukprot:6023436-Alexandrium_andersonii.AAC.1
MLCASSEALELCPTDAKIWANRAAVRRALHLAEDSCDIHHPTVTPPHQDPMIGDKPAMPVRS